MNRRPLTIRRATPEDLEQADYVVCGTTVRQADDVQTTCSCGTAIVHRVTAPARPLKICCECFAALTGIKH